MDLAEKLEILADSAKYDVACTSSGVERAGKHGSLGSCAQAGICHAFTPDGRCVSLLKVLFPTSAPTIAATASTAAPTTARGLLLPRGSWRS